MPVKVLEAAGAAHPDDAALHFRGHQSPGMTVASKLMPTNSVSIMLTFLAENLGLKMSVTRNELPSRKTRMGLPKNDPNAAAGWGQGSFRHGRRDKSATQRGSRRAFAVSPLS